MNRKCTHETHQSGEGKISATVWQLPPPPAGMQWHRTDGWREEWLHSGMRPLLYGEGLERGDEVRHIRPTSEWGNVASLPWIAGVDAGRTAGGDYKSGFYIRTRRPLPQSTEPVVEGRVSSIPNRIAQYLLSGGFFNPEAMDHEKVRSLLEDCRAEFRALTSERDQLRKELEEAKKTNKGLKDGAEFWMASHTEMCVKANAITTENAALKAKLERANVVAGETCQMIHDKAEELETLRSQFRWTPISERLPTEKDANEAGLVLFHNDHTTFAAPWDSRLDDDVKGWLSIPPIPCLPSPPETEEQAMRREFEAWYSKEHGAPANDNAHRAKRASWLAWQAAKQSTQPPA